MSYVARATFAFSVMIMFWYIIIVGFAMDDLAIEKALDPGKANLVGSGSSSVNDTTTGEFSVSNIKDISFLRRFWITVFGMPWWFNLFVGLFNGFVLFMLTLLWILKVIHGEG